MEKLQLIQATLVGANDGSDRLLYLVQVDVDRVQQTFGVREAAAALDSAIRNVQAAIASAFSKSVLRWEASEDFDLNLPNYDPLYRMDGVNVWIMPAVSKNEAYFYLVG